MQNHGFQRKTISLVVRLKCRRPVIKASYIWKKVPESHQFEPNLA